jgi:hypothetical protein
MDKFADKFTDKCTDTFSETFSDKRMKEFTPDFFRQASEAWRQNKIAKSDGQFVYKCQLCDRKVYSHDTMKCWIHRKTQLPNNR